jgi:DNA-binding response OmpR family regulator
MSETDRRRLLIIDDDEDMVRSLSIVMEAAGWEIHSAPNGAAGVAAARQQMPQLIILDLLMPRRDGLTTFEGLRRDESLVQVPVIVLTSITEKLGFSFSAEDMKTHYGRGPDAFLQKPFEPRALLETVQRVLDAGR